MGTLGVVFFKPGTDNSPRLLDRIKQPSSKTVVTKHTIKAFVAAVLPRTAWIYITCLNASILQPVLHLLGDTFRPLVALNTGGRAPLLKQLLQYPLHMAGSDRTARINCQNVSGVFVDSWLKTILQSKYIVIIRGWQPLSFPYLKHIPLVDALRHPFARPSKEVIDTFWLPGTRLPMDFLEDRLGFRDNRVS